MKKYNIQLNKTVQKFLKKADKWVVLSFRVKLEIMQYNPLDTSLDIKPYKWFPWHYRLRVGKYRFIFEIVEQEIIIYFYDADSKGDIYK